jgi:hypothetical protein
MLKTAAVIGAIAAIVFVGLGVMRGEAADTNKRFSVRGLGATTCGKYLEARNLRPKETDSYADWLTGFFTAYNWLQADTYDIAPVAQYKQAGLLIYLDLYCGKNPKKTINDAAIAFTRAVYDKRVKVGS